MNRPPQQSQVQAAFKGQNIVNKAQIGEPSMNGIMALRNIEQEDIIKIAVRKYNSGQFN